MRACVLAWRTCAHLLCRCQIERYVVSGMWRHAQLLCIIQHFRKERIASSSLQLLMGKVGWHQVSLCLQEWRERRREGEREKMSVCSTHFSLGISIKHTVSSFTYVIVFFIAVVCIMGSKTTVFRWAGLFFLYRIIKYKGDEWWKQSFTIHISGNCFHSHLSRCPFVSTSKKKRFKFHIFCFLTL